MHRLLRTAPLPLLALVVATGLTPAASATTCDRPAVIDGVTYCTVTAEDIAHATPPSGAAVIVRGVTADEVYDGTVYVYVASDCPPDMYCGELMTVAELGFPSGPVPDPGARIDAWGSALSGGGMHAVGFAPA